MPRMSWFAWAAPLVPNWPGGWIWSFGMPVMLAYLIYIARRRFHWRGLVFAAAVGVWGLSLAVFVVVDMGVLGFLITRMLRS
jgi:hypothetical protein